MSKFTPDNPAWEIGHWDRSLAFLESHGTKKVFREYCRTMGPQPGKAVLDIGCGSTYWTELIFGWPARRIHLGDIVVAPVEEHIGLVQEMDIRDLPFRDRELEVVHARRVVSNLDTMDDRLQAIKEMRRVAHYVLLVDIDQQRHDMIRKRRENGGMPMPPRNAGLGGLTPDLLHSEAFGMPWEEVPLAGDYYLWTRLHLPLLYKEEAGRMDPLRDLPPAFGEQAAWALAPHRLWVLKGAK